ncbi:hypothetical protein M9458_019379, partial [Cirrhinus mrigala]
GEAFQACLPRKPIPKGPPSAHPGFDAPLKSDLVSLSSLMHSLSQHSQRGNIPLQQQQQQLDIDWPTLREGRNAGLPNR